MVQERSRTGGSDLSPLGCLRLGVSIFPASSAIFLLAVILISAKQGGLGEIVPLFWQDGAGKNSAYLVTLSSGLA